MFASLFTVETNIKSVLDLILLVSLICWMSQDLSLIVNSQLHE